MHALFASSSPYVLNDDRPLQMEWGQTASLYRSVFFLLLFFTFVQSRSENAHGGICSGVLESTTFGCFVAGCLVLIRLENRKNFFRSPGTSAERDSLERPLLAFVKSCSLAAWLCSESCCHEKIGVVARVEIWTSKKCREAAQITKASR